MESMITFLATFFMILTAVGAYIPIMIDLKNKKPMNPTSWWLWLFIDILILISLIQLKANIQLIAIYIAFTAIIAIWSIRLNKPEFSLSEVFISICVIVGGIIMKINLLDSNENVILTSSLAVIAGIPYGIFLASSNKVTKGSQVSALLFCLSAMMGLSLNLLNKENCTFSVFIAFYWFVIVLLTIGKSSK